MCFIQWHLTAVKIRPSVDRSNVSLNVTILKLLRLPCSRRSCLISALPLFGQGSYFAENLRLLFGKLLLMLVYYSYLLLGAMLRVLTFTKMTCCFISLCFILFAEYINHCPVCDIRCSYNGNKRFSLEECENIINS